ncbi:cell wall metabolism sensor histidine kinase WalK [Dysgonomonas sp. 25]|uniref:sensor histidine kinase n=1 Tax=Dysgonomonas sp. 25 TaxID=2302933 RepID=UPI0013D10ACD|nr:ATP-binding protein [Dysgonomonas sp. 25]NDV68850.1 two-component sensor histidine kinase [Dysgonomonas sp. 25]
MKLTYKKRIFFCFVIIFAVFAACIIFVEQKEEKRYRTEALETKLDGYADVIHGYIVSNSLNDSSMHRLGALISILPEEIRVTVIEPDGTVDYDKQVQDVSQLDNHLDRPEILQAQYKKQGSHIRLSTSTQRKYLYYAKSYPDGFVRVALPYDIQTKNLLKADNMFIYIVVALFICVLILLNYVAGRFSQSITRLKDLVSLAKNDKPLQKNITFPDDELGEIGGELTKLIDQKEKNKQALMVEREKLIRHFRFSEEGFAIFNADQKQIYFNTHFIQYVNMIMDRPVLDANEVFRSEKFRPLRDFLADEAKLKNHFSFQLNANGKAFVIRTIIYEDKSFEIAIKDITQAEKTRLIKQEMTNNIAHELRTPVTSLRGFLETLNANHLPEEKRKQFIDKAYMQSIRLSNLIEDVSLLSKIEESSSRFTFEKINLLQLINEVRIDLSDKLLQNNVALAIAVPGDLSINGNYTLLYSIFRNLIDNSLAYGGAGTEIHIANYMQDEKFVYFSYYDTGKGVNEEHLNRLFERFYRVNEGRTRETGGSGLGLSIVRNAVTMHKGEIQVKNRPGAGLEFLFTLKK